jgi:hypothetical protein
MTPRTLRTTIAATAGALLLASAAPALPAAAATAVVKLPNLPRKAPKLTPNHNKKKRLALAQKHVRKSVTAAQLDEPMVLSPLDRSFDDETAMELYGVYLPIPDQEYAAIPALTDPSVFPILLRWHSAADTTYMVDCLVGMNPEFEVLSFQAAPQDAVLEYAEQIVSAKVQLEEKSHITFAVRPAADKIVYTYVRSSNKLTFDLQRCEITAITD